MVETITQEKIMDEWNKTMRGVLLNKIILETRMNRLKWGKGLLENVLEASTQIKYTDPVHKLDIEQLVVLKLSKFFSKDGVDYCADFGPFGYVFAYGTPRSESLRKFGRYMFLDDLE